MVTNRDDVLVALLDCGNLDLSILDNVEYDLCEIIYDLRHEGIRPTLALIMGEVFLKGVSDMKGYIDEMIVSTRGESKDAMLDGDHETASRCARKLAALHKLDPEEDIAWDFNYIGTDIGFVKNEEVYRQYLPDAIKAVEDGIGFSL